MPTAYKSPDEARAALVAALPQGKEMSALDWDAINSAAALVPKVVPGEPSVLSSRAGEKTFKEKVQPAIDIANATVTEARKAAEARQKAALAVAQGEQIPQDVLDEINSAKTPEEQIEAARLTAWDRQIKNARETTEALTLASKASAAAQISALKGQWEERKQLLERSNRAEVATWNQQFLRSGQAEYSPGMTGTFISGKEQEGINKVKALDNEYNAKIAEINQALETKQFELAAKLQGDLATIEDKALTAMSESAKAAAEINKKLKDKEIQVSREMTISDLISQGITEAGEIQDYLNNTEAGETVGDITLEEIEKVLKIVNPSNDLAGLDSDYRTFKYMQEQKDPLVEGMNYLDFKRAVGIASRKDAGGGAGSFELTNTQTSQLLSGGFTQTDAQNIQNDVAAHGIDSVLADTALSPAQKSLIQRVFAGTDSVADIQEEEEQFLTGEYLEALFGDQGLKTAAEEAGYRHLLNSWDTEKQNYVDSLMATVEQYRKAGYNDKEILKMMQ